MFDKANGRGVEYLDVEIERIDEHHFIQGFEYFGVVFHGKGIKSEQGTNLEWEQGQLFDIQNVNKIVESLLDFLSIGNQILFVVQQDGFSLPQDVDGNLFGLLIVLSRLSIDVLLLFGVFFWCIWFFLRWLRFFFWWSAFPFSCVIYHVIIIVLGVKLLCEFQWGKIKFFVGDAHD